jgi:hypothetical protein
MEKERFIELLRNATADFGSAISTDDGDWVVKGFIDINKNIYTISSDTKIVSKLLELYLFPKIIDFAKRNNLKIELAKEQNYYPDITFIDADGAKFAVDIKSSYRKNSSKINGMTLGAFTGYFMNRESSKNINYPYKEYKAHIVLGVIYTAVHDIDERKVYSINQLRDIVSVVNNFQFFVQEKWKISIDRPGSGNTKNIGSVNSIEDILKGNGTFAKLGEDIFNDYWTHYLTNDMAKAAELSAPLYSNINEYKQFKNIK